MLFSNLFAGTRPAARPHLAVSRRCVRRSQAALAQCNAALAEIGVPVIRGFRPKHLDALDYWLHQDQPVPADYPDQTAAILDRLLWEQLLSLCHCFTTLAMAAIF